MVRKSFIILILILCFGLIMTGCPKKTVIKEEPSVKKTEEKAERERAARLEAERKEQETKEAAKIREEEAKKAEAEKERKEFEKSLVAKRTPGIEGEVLESEMIKDIHFDFDKYDIRSEDAEILEQNADLLKKYPNTKIQIEGHCDERGTIEYNLALGERRANSAKKYLISLGISPDLISTISYGKERPLDSGHDEEAWAKNRRAHTVILSR